MKRRVILGDGKLDDNTLLLLRFNNDTQDTVTGKSYAATNISYVAGKFGNCVNFNGKAYVEVNGTDAINESLYSDYTIDFWVYLKSGVRNGIMSKGVSSGDYSFDLMELTDGRIMFRLQYNGNTQDSTCYFTMPRNQWVHLAIVRSSGKHWMVYVNGVHVSGFTSTMVSGYYSSLMIGKYRDYDLWLTGMIDEFRISDVARWTSGFTPPIKAY